MTKHSSQLKILQFTDLHWNENYIINKKIKTVITKISLKYKPDLIVITGDLLHNVCFKNPVLALDDLRRTFDNLRIPWTFVFGNHETEYEDFDITKQAKYLTKTSKYLIFNDYTINDRVGNFKLVIPTKKAYTNLFFLDSGSYETYNDKPSYSWIKESQMNWVGTEIDELCKKNDRDSLYLFFQHIPIPEYKELLDKKGNGEKNEEVGCPSYNSGFYQFLKNKLPNNKKFMFVGHDHYNDYLINDEDFVLCYGRQTGFYQYDPSLSIEQQITEHQHTSTELLNDFKRGARFFEINSDFIMVGRIFEEYQKITDYTCYI